MCKAFSCIVLKSGEVKWQAGIDSHDDLIKKYNLLDDTIDPQLLRFARVEIIPDNHEIYPYLHPEKAWIFKMDERVRPDWFIKFHEDKAWEAFQLWKKSIYDITKFNYVKVLSPVKPFSLSKRIPDESDLALLKNWDSVRDSVWDSVRDSVWDSVGDSVRDSVGASVWAYTSSFFPSIKKWKYVKFHEENPYLPCIKLWERGLVPTFDGQIWRLHSGAKAEIVWEGKNINV